MKFGRGSLVVIVKVETGEDDAHRILGCGVVETLTLDAISVDNTGTSGRISLLVNPAEAGESHCHLDEVGSCARRNGPPSTR